MKDFKKRGSFGNSRGGNSFGRGNFNRPSFNDRGRNDKFGPPEMHEAICAKCGNKCEVPFKPNNKKPVYCKNCFDQNGGNTGGGDRFPKRDFKQRPFEKPRYEDRGAGNQDNQTVKHLEAINAKLERLIQAVQNLTVKGSVKTEGESVAKPADEDATEAPVKKTAKKRVAKK